MHRKTKMKWAGESLALMTLFCASQVVAVVPYWRDPRIHNLGNTGVGGGVHAAIAPLATWMIDEFAYGGVNVRRRVHGLIPSNKRVVDLCCGTGFSATPHARTLGVDTSEQMLRIARLHNAHSNFVHGNAEWWGERDMCDVVTLMYGLHEMPRIARLRVIRNCMRLARERVYILDISPRYSPGSLMLSGEPFLLDYLKHVEEDIGSMAHHWNVSVHVLVENQVTLWVLRTPLLV